mgnify:CR=1 FL=1
MEETNEKQKEKSAKEKRTITVPANGKGRHVMPLLNFLRMLVIPVFRLCLPIRFYGKRKVADGACVYVCNHYRIWDVIYPAATTWEGIHFVSKKSVTTNWFMKGFCKRLKVIEVNRDGSDVRAVMDSLKCLRNGEKISLFPEGTRNKTGAEMLPFKGGAAVMAIKAKVPIVPMMIYKKPKPFRLNHILIGEPFELSEYYDRKLTEEDIREADEKLRNRLLDMRREHAEYLASKKARKKEN